MKIRNGFVSNSSSSSFIVRFDSKYPNTLAIAESMIKNRFDEWRDYSKDDGVDEDHPKEKKVYNNIKKLKRGTLKNMPMFFRSTNYDTYIMAINDKYAYVDTCNNTSWDINSDAIHKVPQDLLEMFPDVDGYGELDLDIKYDRDYYLLENGIIAKSPTEYDTCRNCYDPYWYINGVKYCLECDKERLSRYSKINKIKKLIVKPK